MDASLESWQHQKMKSLSALVVGVIMFANVYAGDVSDRFVSKLKLSSELTAVVAEGDFEARSIGSFSVRLYSSKDAQPGDDTTFFVAGVIQERDGYIERVALADVNGRPAIVVIVRCVGTGQYLSAHAFVFDDKSVKLRASVADLASNADAVSELKKAAAKRN
jgi:hypothetical protein